MQIHHCRPFSSRQMNFGPSPVGLPLARPGQACGPTTPGQTLERLSGWQNRNCCAIASDEPGANCVNSQIDSRRLPIRSLAGRHCEPVAAASESGPTPARWLLPCGATRPPSRRMRCAIPWRDPRRSTRGCGPGPTGPALTPNLPLARALIDWPAWQAKANKTVGTRRDFCSLRVLVALSHPFGRLFLGQTNWALGGATGSWRVCVRICSCLLAPLRVVFVCLPVAIHHFHSCNQICSAESRRLVG